MKRKKLLLLIAAVLTLSVALSGCSGDKKREGADQSPADAEEAAGQTEETAEQNSLGEPMEGGSIVLGIPQDLEDSLDPHIAVAAGTKEILFNIFEGLVKPDSEGNLVSAVASKHNVSEDGKTYTFTLREGVKFHNGADVTVEDVKYSIDRCADSSKGEPLVSAYSIIESTNVLDDKTIEIVLSEPNTEFLAYMTTAIIPKDYTNQDKEPVGTGPFRYVSRSPQENIILEKFDSYWGEPAHLDKVTFKIIADSDTIVMNLKGGSVDMFARITSAQAAELGEEFQIEEGTMNLVQALYLNNARPPFDNKLVRQALCYAVNPQEIMMMIADGKGTEIGSSMFPAFGKYYMEELKDIYTTDLEKARALLKEAGYPDGFDMTVTVPSNYGPHIDTAQVLTEQLKQIGVNVKIELIEWDSWLSDVYGGRNYESTVVGVDASALTARALLERFTSSAPNNFINFKNEEYDRLFEEVKACTEDEKQVELYQQMERILAEDAANVYIQDMAELVALKKSFGGYTFYPLYVQDMSKLYRISE